MPQALDFSSQLCRNAVRCFEMAGEDMDRYKSKPLGLRYASRCPLHSSKGLYMYHLIQPFRRTCRHCCIAGYYHLMPTASLHAQRFFRYWLTSPSILCYNTPMENLLIPNILKISGFLHKKCERRSHFAERPGFEPGIRF